MADTGELKKIKPDNNTKIHFKDGLYGFEGIKDYILLQEENSGVIWSLQAAEHSYPSFIVVNPFLLIKDYKLTLEDSDMKSLGNPAKSDICCMVIAVIKKKLPDSVVNLKSPIVVNVKNKTGRQVIMEDCEYPVRYHLFKQQR